MMMLDMFDSTTRETSTPEPLRALLHPLWLGALAVLLVNDHVLKGALELPLLTGKLSDVAGLIVAPMLLAALLRVRSTRAVWACAAAVAAVFAAINLSPAAANLWDAGLGLFVGSAYTWVDPTDLLALPAAALGVRLLLPAMERRTSGRRNVAYVLLAVGALVCLGSTGPHPHPNPERENRRNEVDPGPFYEARVALLNKTHELQILRLSFLDTEDTTLDCEKVAEAPQRYLSPDVFGNPVRLELLSGQQVGLSGGEVSGNPPPDLGEDQCRAVRVSIETESDIVVFWDGELEPVRFASNPQEDKERLGGPQVVELTADYSEADPADVREFREESSCFRRRFCDAGRGEAAAIPEGATYDWAQGRGQRLFWEQGDRNEDDRREIPPSCERPLSHPGLTWTNLSPKAREIDRLEKSKDGCHTFHLSDPTVSDDAPEEHTVCAPWDTLSRLDPSSYSDTLILESEDLIAPAEGSASGMRGRRLEAFRRVEGSRQKIGTMYLAFGSPTPPVLPEGIGYQIPVGCGPQLASCGRVDLPVHPVLPGGEADRAVPVLNTVDLEDSSKAVQFVRALYRPVSRPGSACEAEPSRSVKILEGRTEMYVEAVVLEGFDLDKPQ